MNIEGPEIKAEAEKFKIRQEIQTALMERDFPKGYERNEIFADWISSNSAKFSELFEKEWAKSDFLDRYKVNPNDVINRLWVALAAFEAGGRKEAA
ncbi:MAG TPA: hypothetical protein VJJ27_01840 [Candidatus Paceibacterota bacterium]